MSLAYWPRPAGLTCLASRLRGMGLVIVQRGHCFRTTGATGAPGEQAFTEAAADRAELHIEAAGHQCRVINADVPDDSYRGDLFVAIHYDSSDNPAARGASVGYQTPEGNLFAQAWKRHYTRLGWTGGFRPDNYTAALHGYYGTRHAVEVGTRRAFIAEAGFGSSPADAALMAPPEGTDRVGRAIAAAVIDIIGPGTVPAPTPVPDLEELPDMFLYSGPNTPVFFCDSGASVGLNEATDMPTFVEQKVKHFKLDGDTYLKFRDRFPGA